MSCEALPRPAMLVYDRVMTWTAIKTVLFLIPHVLADARVLRLRNGPQLQRANSGCKRGFAWKH